MIVTALSALSLIAIGLVAASLWYRNRPVDLEEYLSYLEDGGWGSEDEQEAQAWAPEDDVQEYSPEVFPPAGR